MYNMKFNFSIMGFHYSISLSVIILAIILALILSGNLLCACGQVHPYEGFQAVKHIAAVGTKKVVEKMTNKKNGGKKGKEGFVGSNINNGQGSQYDIESSKIDTSKWFGVNMQNTDSQYVKDFNKRPANVPTGTDSSMLLFKDTEFTPECCANGSAFSNSVGCACLSGPQYNFLIERGGNNTPYSEY